MTPRPARAGLPHMARALAVAVLASTSLAACSGGSDDGRWCGQGGSPWETDAGTAALLDDLCAMDAVDHVDVRAPQDDAGAPPPSVNVRLDRADADSVSEVLHRWDDADLPQPHDAENQWMLGVRGQVTDNPDAYGLNLGLYQQAEPLSENAVEQLVELTASVDAVHLAYHRDATATFTPEIRTTPGTSWHPRLVEALEMAAALLGSIPPDPVLSGVTLTFDSGPAVDIDLELAGRMDDPAWATALEQIPAVQAAAEDEAGAPLPNVCLEVRDGPLGPEVNCAWQDDLEHGPATRAEIETLTALVEAAGGVVVAP